MGSFARLQGGVQHHVPSTVDRSVTLTVRLDRQRRSSHEELRRAIVAWIGANCQRTCRERALGMITPVEFESLYEMLNGA